MKKDGSHILHLVDFLSASIELPPNGSSLLVSQVELGKKIMSIMKKYNEHSGQHDENMIEMIFKTNG